MPRRNRSRSGAVSALLSSANTLRDLTNVFAGVGGTEEEFWRFLANRGCQRQVALALLEGPEYPVRVYPHQLEPHQIMPVTAGWSISDLHRSARTWRDAYLVHGVETKLRQAQETGNLVFRAKGFGRHVTPEEVIGWCDDNNSWVATRAQALAAVREHYALARPVEGVTLVALGSYVEHQGRRQVTTIRTEEDRRLRGTHFTAVGTMPYSQFGRQYRFLVVHRAA